MDPFTLLKRDHKRALAFLDELLDARTVEKRTDLFEDLKKHLREHMKLEEKYFYPILSRHHHPTGMRAERIRRGHHESMYLLKKLDEMDKADLRWNTLVARLQKAFEEHAYQEEDEVFTQLQQYLDTGEQQQLGKQMIRKKEKLAKGFLQRMKEWFSSCD